MKGDHEKLSLLSRRAVSNTLVLQSVSDMSQFTSQLLNGTNNDVTLVPSIAYTIMRYVLWDLQTRK